MYGLAAANPFCLNPYCIGSSNHARISRDYGNVSSGLNPYCIGSSNHAFGVKMHTLYVDQVLILIVLDHLIMPEFDRDLEYCLIMS